MSYAERARRFLAERADQTANPITLDEINEINEINEKREERSAVAMIDRVEPTTRPLPPNADDWDQGMRAAFTPILHIPPPGCLGPRVCCRIGPCERHAAGRPCLVTEGA